MKPLKIALIGAGSYVFGPSMLRQALLEAELGDCEMALVDLDREIVEAMAGVGRRMATAAGKRVSVTAHTDRQAALDGGDFVICAAAVEGMRRASIDHAIIREYAPDHVMTEFGGVGGISYSLRQIALINALTADMKRLCPEAWLFNAANPLPRVSQAAHESGIKTIGFCSVAVQAYRMLCYLWTGKTIDYPFEAAAERWEIRTGGVNHFTFILEAWKRATGDSILDEIRRRIAAGGSTGNPYSDWLCQQTGYLAASGDDHVEDFVAPSPLFKPRHEFFHGSPLERGERVRQLRAVAAGEISHERLFDSNLAWERPIDVIAALQTEQPRHFPRLNTVNRGQMPDVQIGVFVETPCRVSRNGIESETIQLPDSLRHPIAVTATVTDLIVQAAAQRSRELLEAAVQLDPTIVDKAAGMRALEACLEAHKDLIPAYL